MKYLVYESVGVEIVHHLQKDIDIFFYPEFVQKLFYIQDIITLTEHNGILFVFGVFIESVDFGFVLFDEIQKLF